MSAEGDLAVATRGGVKTVHIAKDGDVTVGMGRALLPEGDVTVSVGERSWPARNVNMGNPHAVAFVDDLVARRRPALPAARSARPRPTRTV